MAAVITKKVRMKATDARRLRRVAKDLGLTESEVLRQGVEHMEQVGRRHRNVETLIALLGDTSEPPKVRPRVKW